MRIIFMGDYLENKKTITKVTINYGNDKKLSKFLKGNQANIISIPSGNLDNLYIKFEAVKCDELNSLDYMEVHIDSFTENLIKSFEEKQKKADAEKEDNDGTDKIWRHLPEWFYLYDIEVIDCNELDKLYIYYTDEEVYAKIEPPDEKNDGSKIRLIKKEFDENQNKMRWSYIGKRCTITLGIITLFSLLEWFVVLPILLNFMTLEKYIYGEILVAIYFVFILPLIMTKDYIVETNKRYKNVLQAPPTKDIVPLELDVLKD